MSADPDWLAEAVEHAAQAFYESWTGQPWAEQSARHRIEARAKVEPLVRAVVPAIRRGLYQEVARLTTQIRAGGVPWIRQDRVLSTLLSSESKPAPEIQEVQL